MVWNEFLYFFRALIGTPAILIGIFGMIGSMLQRKTISQVIIATIKTITGFLILGGGASIIITSLNHFDTIFEAIFNLQGVVPNNEGVFGILIESFPQIATTASLIMILGMVCNILLAKFTQFKYVFLSGHVLFYMSAMLAAAMFQIGFVFQTDWWMIIIIGGLFMGMYMILTPLMCQKYMKSITKTDDIAMAHTGSLGYVLAGLIGSGISRIKKGKVKSTEDINFPKGLAFLRNGNVSVAITMFFIFSILYIAGWAVLGRSWFISQDIIGEEGSVIIEMIIRAFTFAAGMEVVLFGVRTVLGELLPAFKGISDKWVKDGKAALDCPIVFPYAPNAVYIGFLSSLTAGILTMGLTIWWANIIPSAVVILPGIIAHFFTGATAGVFGNAKGGILGAIFGSFVNGIIITLVPLIFIMLSLIPSSSNNVENMSWGDSDYIFGLLIGLFTFFSNPILIKWLVFGIWVFIFIIFIVACQTKYWLDVKNKKIIRMSKAEKQEKKQEPKNKE